MAIYSLNLGFISRSEGRSSVAFSAYISASRQVDARTGTIHNYANKDNVIISRVLAPLRAPEWALTPALLWNKVEQFEDDMAALRFRCNWDDPEKQRKSLEARDRFLNSTQTAQTIMGALPIELSQEQAEACVEDFLHSRFVLRGLVVQYAIHWDNGNPHFHGLITRRPLLDDTFSSKKDRDIVSKFEHNFTRKHWEVIANKHLARAGFEVRIDSRSNKDRGSLFLSSSHEGYYAQSLSEQGLYSWLVESNEKVRARNIEIICETPEALIHEISSKRTTFTAKHLSEEIIRRVGGDGHLLAVLRARLGGLDIKEVSPHENFKADLSDLKEVATKFANSLLSHEDMVSPLGKNINRDPIFTSTAYKNQEGKIIKFANTLDQRFSKRLPEKEIGSALERIEKALGYGFSSEQRVAVHYLSQGSDIRILNGQAGTGKTTLLKAVASAYSNAGYRVLGTGFQGKAVEIMEREIGIPCKTLDSFKVFWERYAQQKVLLESKKLWGKPRLYAIQKMKDLEKHLFTNKDVILVDEANMIGGGLWETFLEEASVRSAKVLIIQDTAQIKSREPGDYGRLFAEKFGFCETRNVVRQRISWQRECSALLNEGNLRDGLLPYHQKGHLNWCENGDAAQASLVQAYLNSLTAHPDKSHIALAYRNLDVEALNQAIRQKLKDQGSLGNSFKIARQEFSKGDRIRFTQNDHSGWFVKNTSENVLQFFKGRFILISKGVKNGTFGTVLSYNKWTSFVHVRLDDGRSVKFNPTQYAHVTHGYAMGIHKSEGSTFDRTFVMLDPLLDPAALLVAMTRHRDDIQAFVNRDQIIDFKALIEKIGRPAFRETLHDYEVSEDQRPFLDRIQQYRDLVMEAVTLREEMEGSLEPNQPLYKHSAYPSYQDFFHQKKEIAELILREWDQHKPYVRLAGLRRDVLEVEAGLRPRLLSDLEHRASIQVQGYMDLTHKTRNLWKSIQNTHPGVLVKGHPLYSDYKELKAERDSLASVFQENEKLYRPFLRTQKEEVTGDLKDFWGTLVPDKERVFWSTVQNHAKAHLRSQTQKLYEERLTPEELASYKVLQDYREACLNAALSFQETKDSEVPYRDLSAFYEARARRDDLAFQIVSNMALYEQFFERLKISEEKVLEHATFSEIRTKIQKYRVSKDIEARAEHAKELETLTIDKKQDSKIQMLLKQEGLDFKRIPFDILFEEKVKAGEISKDVSAEYVFNHLRDYTKSIQDAAKAWKTKSPTLKETLQARKDAALRLFQNETALLLFKELYPERHEKLQAYKEQSIHHKPFIKSDRVLAELRGHYENLATDLLGPSNPYMSSKSFLRFGDSGKIVVNISGPKEGLWYDFSAENGGNIFGLLQREKGLDFKEAVEYCARFINMPEEDKYSRRFTLMQGGARQDTVKQEILENEEDKDRLKAVLNLQHQSKPIEGTVAETYLRKERKIAGVFAQDLRYLPKRTQFIYKGEQKILTQDCFAAFGRNSADELCNVQLTKLNEDGKRALSPDGEKLNKIQYGISKGTFVTVQQETATEPRVFIAEGVETALSLKDAGLRGKIVASLGVHNIKNYEGGEKEVIICADHDGPASPTSEVIQQAREHFKELGKSVVMVKPQKEGQDFNDVLKKEGIEGVQAYLSPYTVKRIEPLKDKTPDVQKHYENIQTLSAHLGKKLHELNEDPYATEAKKELSSHAKFLHKNPEQLQALHKHAPEIVKEMQRVIQREQSKGFER